MEAEEGGEHGQGADPQDAGPEAKAAEKMDAANSDAGERGQQQVEDAAARAAAVPRNPLARLSNGGHIA